MIAQKKGDIKAELSDAIDAIETLGGTLNQVKDLKLDEFNDDRCLVIIDKIEESSGKYPRRPGIPAKRPIS